MSTGCCEGVHNVREAVPAAVGDGVQDDRNALNVLANTTIPSSGGVMYFPPGPYKIASDMTFPRHVTLRFATGAKLLLPDAVTVTILGGIDGELTQIFALTDEQTGTGRVRFSVPGSYGVSPLVTEVYPQWWGAKADFSTDDAKPLQRCFDAAAGFPSDFWGFVSSATSTTVTKTGAGWTANQFVAQASGQANSLVKIIKGTGAGQERRIASNTSDTLTLDTAWATTPDSTSQFTVRLSTTTPRWADVPVHLPPGVYMTSAPLRLTDVVGFRLKGSGLENTTIMGNGGYGSPYAFLGIGEVQSATANTLTRVRRSGEAAWATDQWKGDIGHLKRVYVVNPADGSVQSLRIIGNSADTLTLQSNFGTVPTSSFRFLIAERTVLDLNGTADCVFEDFGLSVNRGAAFTSCLYYHRNIEDTARHSSSCAFKYIRAGGDYTDAAFRVGNVDEWPNGVYQEDITTWTNCRAFGGWYTVKNDMVQKNLFWQHGFYFGTGFFGNNLIHTLFSVSSVGNQYGLTNDATSVAVYGGVIQSNRADLRINNGTQGCFRVSGIRSEGSQMLLDTASGQSANFQASLSDIEVQLNDLQYHSYFRVAAFIYWRLAGELYLRNIRVLNQPKTGILTASAGATETTLVRSGAGWTANQYQGWWVRITAGAGAGQFRRILSNTADTLTIFGLDPELSATNGEPWSVIPDASSEFYIYLMPVIVNDGVTGRGLVRAEGLSVMDTPLEYIGGEPLQVDGYYELDRNGNVPAYYPGRSMVDAPGSARSALSFGQSAYSSERGYRRAPDVKVFRWAERVLRANAEMKVGGRLSADGGFGAHDSIGLTHRPVIAGPQSSAVPKLIKALSDYGLIVDATDETAASDVDRLVSDLGGSSVVSALYDARDLNRTHVEGSGATARARAVSDRRTATTTGMAVGDGTYDDGVNIGNYTGLNGTAKCTIVAWVGTLNAGEIFKRWVEGNPALQQINIGTGLLNGERRLHLRIGAPGGTERTVTGSTPIKSGYFYKVCATFDGTLSAPDRVKLYVSAYDFRTKRWIEPNAAETLTFGGSAAATPTTLRSIASLNALMVAHQFFGFLDEVRVWKDRALTLSEIRSERLGANPLGANLRYTFDGNAANSGSDTGFNGTYPSRVVFCSDDLSHGPPLVSLGAGPLYNPSAAEGSRLWESQSGAQVCLATSLLPHFDESQGKTLVYVGTCPPSGAVVAAWKNGNDNTRGGRIYAGSDFIYSSWGSAPADNSGVAVDASVRRAVALTIGRESDGVAKGSIEVMDRAPTMAPGYLTPKIGDNSMGIFGTAAGLPEGFGKCRAVLVLNRLLTDRDRQIVRDWAVANHAAVLV